MNRVSLALAVVAMYSACPGQGRAQVVLFNDYGPAYTYDTVNAYGVSGSSSSPGSDVPAMEFTPVNSGAVGSVAFGINLISGTNSVTFKLMTNNGGVPGSVLESYSFVNQMGSFGKQNSPLIANSVLNPTLAAGTSYWMVAVPGATDTYAAWNWNNQSVTGDVMGSGDGGSTWHNDGTLSLGAFEVLAAPEPSSFALLGLALTAGAAGRWWQRRRQSRAATAFGTAPNE
jgi:PEP-CTERM motif